MAIDPATFRLRFPALGAATDDQIGYWLTDAGRIVTVDWGEDQEPASFAFAAHGLVSSGAVSTGSVSLPAGITSFRSGAMSVSMSEDAANASVTEGYGSTSYGREFLTFLRRHVGGMRLVSYPC